MTHSRGVILAYHRVADLPSDPQCLAVTPRNFAGHLEVITRRGVALPLDTFLASARAGSLPKGATAVTFDDGYADMLEAALPTLEAHSVPARLFVATATLDSSRAFWWDELERLCLHPGTLPSRVMLDVGTHRRVWALAEHARWTAADAAGYAAWSIQAPPPTARHRMYMDLCGEVARLPAEGAERILMQLAAIAGVDRDAMSFQRPLRSSQLAEVSRASLMTMGSHTDSHPSLARLAAPAQHREIAAGRRRLEAALGATMTSLAYPFGGTCDVSPVTRAAAREAGVTTAFTTQPRVVDTNMDPLATPRVVVRDWTREQFASYWSRWVAA